MKSVLKSVLFGLAAAIVTVTVLTAVFALIALRGSDPTRYVQSFGIAIFIVSVLVCGFVSARMSEGGIFGAPLCAIGTYLFLYLLTTIISGAASKGFIYLLLLYLGAFAAGFVGIFIGRHKKPTKPKSLKKYIKLKKAK